MFIKARTVKRSISILLTVLLSVINIPFGVNDFNTQVVKAAEVQTSFYVSPTGDDNNPGTLAQPFQTITKARDAVREVNVNMTGDIHVYLRGGQYRIADTIKFGPQDSGTNGKQIYYEAYNNEVPVINGATQVTGWSVYKNGIYKATLNRDKKLRSLIVNDKAADLTMKTVTAQGGYNTYTVTAGQADWAWSSGSKSDGVKYNLTDLPASTINEDDIEIMNGTTWNENIVCARDLITTATNSVLLLQQPYGAIAQTPGWGTAFTTSGTHKIYNVFEWLDSPGEFYFDKSSKTLYYYPRTGEDMANADVEAPTVERLIDISGKSTTDRVKNINFQGITFANSDYNLVDVAGSHGRSTVQTATAFIAFGDGNWHNSTYRIIDTLQAMIGVTSSESVNFYNNIIENSGCDGISMVNDVVNCEVIGNYFTNTASSALTIGHPQHVYIGDGGTHEKYAPGIEGVCKNITVNNNMFYDICTAPGFGGINSVCVFYGDTVQLTHNTLMKTASAAVLLGWGWTNFNASTTCRNNKLDNNRLIDNVNRTHDSGALYTLGQQPGTTMNENFVRGIPSQKDGPTYGLHVDEGSAYMEVNDNVLDIDPNVKYTINCEDYGGKHDLTIKNTYATTYKMGVNPPKSDIDIPVVVPDNVWPLAQYNIALNSGVQDEYRSIIPKDLFTLADTVFPASCAVDTSTNTIGIRSAQDTTKTVWFAPSGTTSFVEGATMTSAAGDANTIKVPVTAGTYKLFIVNADGTVAGVSSFILRVSQANSVAVAPQAEDFTDGTKGSQWSVTNEDTANYSVVSGAGLKITSQAGDISDGSIKNMFVQQADGDWIAETKVTLSKAQDTNGQQHGLVIYGDNKNYIKLDYERVNGNSVYGLYNVTNGTKTLIGNTVTANNILTHYFRILKVGTKYSAYYSTNGTTYTMLGSTAMVGASQLGLMASGTATTATFEYVKLGTPADVQADASLSAITVSGAALSGFSSGTLNYSVYAKDDDPVPTVTATATDPKAVVTINDAVNTQGTTTITVTNGFNKRVYTITFGSTMKYEGESATLSGGAKVMTDHKDYSGTGFVAGLYNTLNAKATFNVTVPTAGKYALVLRYADTNATSNLGLYVNGSKLKNLSLPASGGWDTWKDATEYINLNSGANTIAFNVETAANAVNIDYITLTKVDSLPPTWPQGAALSITNLAEKGMSITWPVAEDNTAVTGYKIYKSGALVATVAATVHSYDMTGLVAGTTYTIKVEASDAIGNTSTDGPSKDVSTLPDDGFSDITYYGVEGSTNPNPAAYAQGTGLTLLDASRTGFDFIGWFDAEMGGNKVTSIGTTATNDFTLYARWQKVTVGVGVPLTNLNLWLDADDIVADSGNKVSRWAYSDANGTVALTQSTADAQPVLVTDGNGFKYVSFDGTNDLLQKTGFKNYNTKTQLTIMIVSRFRGTDPDSANNGDRYSALFIPESGSWGSIYLSPYKNSVKTRFGVGNQNGVTTYTRPAAVTGFSSTFITKNGATQKIYVNGSVVTTNSAAATTLTNNAADLFLGKGISGGSDYFFTGDIAEVLIYDRALTDAEITQVNQYINDKYSVAAPTASVSSGTYETLQRVALSSTTVGAKIYYTTDGSVPTISSKEYTSAISVATGSAIKAIAVKSGMIDSTVSTFNYVILTKTQLSSFDTIAAIDAGSAGNAMDAAAVIALLPGTVKANGTTVTIPVSAWTDTDGYNPTTAGSYTFTATLGELPEGYLNDSNLTATVEVVVSPAIATYTVTYDLNGGSTETMPVDTNLYHEGDNVSVVSGSSITLANHTFGGWSTTQNGGAVGSTYTMEKANVTFYAIWVEDGKFIVTYDLNGGTGTVPSDNHQYYAGDNVSVASGSSITKANHTFGGWSTTPNGGAVGSTYTLGTTNVTFYAIWIEDQKYSVAYDLNGGTGTLSVDGTQYNAGDTITLAAGSGLSKLNHTFGGWSTTPNGGAVDSTYTMGTTNVTFYALWVENGKFIVTYDLNGGTGTLPVDGTQYYAGDTITLAAGSGLSKANYTFTGWSLTQGGSAISTPTATMGSSNTTYYAVWTAVSTPSTPSTPQTPIQTDNKEVRSGSLNGADQTNSSTIVAIDITRDLKDNKKVDSVVLSQSKTEDVIKKVLEQKKDTVQIVVKDIPNNKADEVSVTVKHDSVKELSENNVALKVTTDDVSIQIPKETIKNISGNADDLFFHIVPIRDTESKTDAIQNAITAKVVQEVAGNSEVITLGTPMVIETNYQNLQTKLLFSLNGITLPEDKELREKFLSSLGVYIKHSDGEQEFNRGTIKYAEDGSLLGIEIDINKFSTFVLVSVTNTAPEATDLKITGKAAVGNTLKVSYTYKDADGDQQGASIISWYRADNSKGKNKKLIASGSKLTYKLTKKDQGKYIFVEVTPVAKSGTLNGNIEMTKVKVAASNVAPKAISAKISGKTVVGSKLTLTYTYQDVENDKEDGTLIQWYRANSADGKGKTKIKNANKLTYTLDASDAGKFLIVELTPVAKTGSKTGSITIVVTKTSVKKK